MQSDRPSGVEHPVIQTGVTEKMAARSSSVTIGPSLNARESMRPCLVGLFQTDRGASANREMIHVTELPPESYASFDRVCNEFTLTARDTLDGSSRSEPGSHITNQTTSNEFVLNDLEILSTRHIQRTTHPWDR